MSAPVKWTEAVPTCGHGQECWRVTCSNGRYGWALWLAFCVLAGAYVWVGLTLGFIQG